MKLSWNILINNEFVVGDEADLFFQAPIDWIADKDTDMWTILVFIGAFKSRSDAKRNGFERTIPDGWTELKVGKFKVHVCILKPTIDNLTPNQIEV